MRASLLIACCFALLVAAPLALAGSASDGDKAASEGDWASAVNHYLDAHLKKPDDRALTLKLADAARRTRQRDALDAARDALFGITKKNAKDWDAWVALGGTTLERARTMTSGSTIAMEYDDAKVFFQEAIKGKPDLEKAHTGLAQVHRAQARADEAMKVIEDYLAKGTKTQADALFWKGQLNYDRAYADFQAKGGVYPLSDAAKQLFTKAQGAFEASSIGDPTNFETFMQLAYASQFVGDPATAQESYVKAIPLNLHSERPMRGLTALLKHDPAKLNGLIDQLEKKHTAHPALHYFVGYNRYTAKDYRGAVKSFNVYAAHGLNPAEGHFYLGLCHQRLDDPAKARAAFLKALKANPAHEGAAFQLDAPLREGGAQRASRSLQAAKELIAGYEELLKIAPNNTLLLNNAALTLRDAYVPNANNKAWTPIVKQSRDYYVKASEIIGPFDTVARAQPLSVRYDKAQIVSDTGLMFQFYPVIKDLEKAEEYYSTALEYIEDGYFDAWKNLGDIYAAQKRWQELYDLAAVGKDKLIADGKGTPHSMGRTLAERIMKKLIDEGKAED